MSQDVEALSEVDLIDLWRSTRMTASEPPFEAYTSAMMREHRRTMDELMQRGYEEVSSGWWIRADLRSYPSDSAVLPT